MEIAATIGSSMAEEGATIAADGIWKQIKYVLDYNENMEDLTKKLQALRDAKARVSSDVDAAKKRPEQIHDDVRTWLKDVDKKIPEVEEILKEDGKAEKSCCIGLLPNVKNRYYFSKRAKSEASATQKLADRKFDRVGYRVPREKTAPVEGYEAFESRNAIFQSIVEALKDGNVDKVGVWGLPGVGKTTLAKRVADQLRAEGIFQSFAFTDVGEVPDPRKIQSDIADWLGFKLEVESKECRSSDLRERLKQEKNILLIFDNVRNTIELGEIGVPTRGDKNPCKILITARNENVLLQIDAKPHFRLDALTKEEAWKLFNKKVGTMEDPKVQQVADEIVKRCAGLPIFILTVAVALKNKKLYEWNVALQTLKRFGHCDITAEPYAALQLSYDSLGEDAKFLFLLCAQFSPINIYMPFFFPHCVGLGMFAQCNSLEEKRDMLLKVVNDIKSSSFWLDGDYYNKDFKMDEFFKMHDIVHDFAFSMLDKDNESIILKMGVQLEEWPLENHLKNCTRICLPQCSIATLPATLECPKLLSFALWGRVFSLEKPLNIPNQFFQRVNDLRVLDLRNLNLSRLPSSLQLLTNLRTLRLDYSSLGDISIIGVLKNLEILILQGCKIAHFPNKIAQLTCLQLLDLRDSNIGFLPPNVLSCLTELEQLYMGRSFLKWGLICLDCQRINGDSVELKNLNKLTDLDIQFLDLRNLSVGLFSDKLERFFIIIGDSWHWNWRRKKGILRTLKLKLNESIQAVEKVDVLLNKTEDLYLDSIGGVDVDLIDLNQDGFRYLKNLQLQNCDELRYVFDFIRTGPCTVFPRLESLVVESSRCLEQLFKGSPKAEILNRLKLIRIESCDGLRNLFPLSFAKCLSRLEEIEVTNCEKLEGIFVAEMINEEDDGNEDKIQVTMLRRLKLKYLPFLAHVFSPTSDNSFGIHTRKNEAFFNGKIVFPNIEDLKLSSIKVHQIWDFGLPDSYSCIGKLTKLVIDGCENIKNVFATSVVSSLVQLQMIKISNCKLLEKLITPAEHEERIKETKICFPKLESLVLKHLHSMVAISTSDLIECSNLKSLWIEDCPKLKTFTTNSLSSENLSIATALFNDKVMFPNLESFRIGNMLSLTMLWHGEVHEDSFCKLKLVLVEGITNLHKLFPSSMLRKIYKLETLEVTNCGSLEEIFDLHELRKSKHHDRIRTLKRIHAEELPNLKHIWNPQSQWHSVVQNLESLEVYNCETLMQLAPEYASFDNMTSLIVYRCGNLASLFTCWTATSLKKLRELKVENCNMLEEIVSAANESEAEINFHGLEILELVSLGNMTSFCSKNYTLKFPSLVKLIVNECPQMEFFCPGHLSAPKLKTLWLTRFMETSRWKADLNTTIRQLYKERRRWQDPILRDGAPFEADCSSAPGFISQ